ncbi:MAG: AAA family ATPase [Bacillota bacterium]|jgi:MoxR-like ATPase|nr:MoxR family ATPase [Candidatus Fermentithermobacillaceae bacterium]
MADFGRVHQTCDRVLNEIGKVVIGKREQAKMLLRCLSVSGHALLEDVPGTGKTLLARSFARATGLTFKRIQFTPDLLPSDVVGVNVFSQKDGDFRWVPGPVFANIVLADELNRATPRTQSSLLEAMEERQVTSEGQTRKLPSPFMVVATQNPIEMEGTFPLPEAQVDRFLVKIDMGYPGREEELQIIERYSGAGTPEVTGEIEVAMTQDDLEEMREAAASVKMSQEVGAYLMSLVEATREHPALLLGVSPRGALHLTRLAKASAALDGRDYLLPDDIKDVAVPCLAHRITPKSETSLRGKTRREIMAQVLEDTPVPVGPAGDARNGQ